MAKRENHRNRCVLCGRTDAEVPFMLQGIDGYICSDCAKMAASPRRSRLSWTST